MRTVSSTRICRLALTPLASVAVGRTLVRSGMLAWLSNGEAEARGVCARTEPAQHNDAIATVAIHRGIDEPPCPVYGAPRPRRSSPPLHAAGSIRPAWRN